MGGRGGGPGRLRGEGAPPGRKLNINQSIAVRPATEQRRSCRGGRGTGEGRVGSREEGEEGRREPAVGERCGEDRARAARRGTYGREPSAARGGGRGWWVGAPGCRRELGPGVSSSSSSSRRVQGAAASPSPEAH